MTTAVLTFLHGSLVGMGLLFIFIPETGILLQVWGTLMILFSAWWLVCRWKAR